MSLSHIPIPTNHLVVGSKGCEIEAIVLCMLQSPLRHIIINKWQDLAIRLGLSIECYKELEKIANKEGISSLNIFVELLQNWVNKSGENAKLDILTEQLYKCECTHFAELIIKEFSSNAHQCTSNINQTSMENAGTILKEELNTSSDVEVSEHRTCYVYPSSDESQEPLLGEGNSVCLFKPTEIIDNTIPLNNPIRPSTELGTKIQLETRQQSIPTSSSCSNDTLGSNEPNQDQSETIGNFRKSRILLALISPCIMTTILFFGICIGIGCVGFLVYFFIPMKTALVANLHSDEVQCIDAYGNISDFLILKESDWPVSTRLNNLSCVNSIYIEGKYCEKLFDEVIIHAVRLNSLSIGINNEYMCSLWNSHITDNSSSHNDVISLPNLRTLAFNMSCSYSDVIRYFTNKLAIDSLSDIKIQNSVVINRDLLVVLPKVHMKPDINSVYLDDKSCLLSRRTNLNYFSHIFQNSNTTAWTKHSFTMQIRDTFCSHFMQLESFISTQAFFRFNDRYIFYNCTLLKQLYLKFYIEEDDIYNLNFPKNFQSLNLIFLYLHFAKCPSDKDMKIMKLNEINVNSFEIKSKCIIDHSWNISGIKSSN